MNLRRLNTLIPPLVSLALLLGAGSAAAEPRVTLVDQEGFCASVREVDQEGLAHSLQRHRARLVATQSRLAAKLETMAFDKLDTLITLVLPGGLIYAAIKKESQRQKQHRLRLLNDELALLNGDLLALSPEDAGKTLAFK